MNNILPSLLLTAAVINTSSYRSAFYCFFIPSVHFGCKSYFVFCFLPLSSGLFTHWCHLFSVWQTGQHPVPLLSTFYKKSFQRELYRVQSEHIIQDSGSGINSRFNSTCLETFHGLCPGIVGQPGLPDRSSPDLTILFTIAAQPLKPKILPYNFPHVFLGLLLPPTAFVLTRFVTQFSLPFFSSPQTTVIFPTKSLTSTTDLLVLHQILFLCHVTHPPHHLHFNSFEATYISALGAHVSLPFNWILEKKIRRKNRIPRTTVNNNGK